ncbi:hypothetical protein EJ02DRAFT_471196 [Clathrospora elynae]|uniref:Uncharacterized protein n=1 Tax=Clathrospora elynae TaxID=706981 RepID=A0A6A5S676_9PLEO|nr:hypothetical protein EJ02DRAFT_471196 [Clathrospora elynae]
MPPRQTGYFSARANQGRGMLANFVDGSGITAAFWQIVKGQQLARSTEQLQKDGCNGTIHSVSEATAHRRGSQSLAMTQRQVGFWTEHSRLCVGPAQVQPGEILVALKGPLTEPANALITAGGAVAVVDCTRCSDGGSFLQRREVFAQHGRGVDEGVGCCFLPKFFPRIRPGLREPGATHPRAVAYPTWRETGPIHTQPRGGGRDRATFAIYERKCTTSGPAGEGVPRPVRRLNLRSLLLARSHQNRRSSASQDRAASSEHRTAERWKVALTLSHLSASQPGFMPRRSAPPDDSGCVWPELGDRELVETAPKDPSAPGTSCSLRFAS